MKKDYFASKAKDYDKEQKRVDNVANISNAILKNITLKPNMYLVDFGSGSGLLLENIAPYVEKITAIDVSASMNNVLKEKLNNIDCNVDILELDLSTTNVDLKVDGIISSMTMHHIKDVEAMFKKFYKMLKPNAFIAIADLNTEDGSFHKVDTGVEHFGFEPSHLAQKAKNAGFKDIQTMQCSTIIKPYGEYEVFLLIAKKT